VSDRYDVIVVGAGPAGLSASAAAAAAGAKTLLLDENDRAGGQLRYRLIELRSGDGECLVAPRLADRLFRRALDSGVEVELDARGWGLFAGFELAVEREGQSRVMAAERVVLAAGSVDRAVPFPGGSLPGVLTARALQVLLHRDFVLPGRRFAVIGHGSEAREIKRDIELAEGEVVATLPSAEGVVAFGEHDVQGIAAAGQTYEADIIVVATGRLPDTSLAMMAECEAGRGPEVNVMAPAVDERMQTSVPGLYLAGDCAGPCSAEVALAEGAYAGACVAASLGLIDAGAFGAARETYLKVAGGRSEELARRARSFAQVYRAPVGVVEA
jgi:pyruvate/2-oxoglutarate dehydrogenase complex dihydrolipoamide dehydrogenase (E3) component